MKKETMHIKSTKRIALDTVEMVLENNYMSQTAVPGQFLHLLVSGHTLRRPISIGDVNKDEHTVTILFKMVGSGTQDLASYQAGMTIDALGPLGNGFQLDNETQSTVLLIGGGIGVPPMYYLGKTLARLHMNIISVLGFQTGESVFYEEKFRALGETMIVTNDGSYGDKGFVTDVLHKLASFDCYYACGPLPMLQGVTNSLSNKPGYISLEERMGCGIGACFACVIPTDNKGGYKKICKDGPVFHAQEVSL